MAAKLRKGDPITPAGIKTVFDTEFVNYVNGLIVWASNNEPFSQVANSEWGGTTSGLSSTLSAASLGSAGSAIDAQTIVAAVVAAAEQYSSIRRYRPVKFVQGAGGNSGSEPSPGLFTYGNQVGYLDSSRAATFSTSGTDPAGADDPVISDEKVSADSLSGGSAGSPATLDGLIARLKTEWQQMCNDGDTAVGYSISVCHSSCHSSCHQSRGRR